MQTGTQCKSQSESDITAAAPASSSTSSTKRSKKGVSKKESSTPSGDALPRGEDAPTYGSEDEARQMESDGRSDEEEEATRQDQEDRMDEDDPFSSGFLGRGGPSGLSNTLRALSGMMSGMTSRLRGILENLRMRDDPSVQLIALTELSEILLVSNEDNLAGHFSPDQYVKELVALMQPNDFGEENPEMMLLACRCIANLMEALPAATASVVYGGAVPILCQKLLEIHFIDLAEQALSTLEKISVEFPSSIVREGGLTACLTYLDFFATSTQRTAVTTAANCCRNIPDDSFPVVRDVMPILLNVLGSNDQKVVEQGSLCVCRVIDSFKFQEAKLEELVSPELLQAIIRLLLPGSTNMIGPTIHTHFLKVLAIIARASPRLSVELLKMNIVDTLYQILTGVSPPSGLEDMATKIDKNIIMQALIRTPRDQVLETLNVICELLPTIYRDSLIFVDDIDKTSPTELGSMPAVARSRTTPNDRRLELLRGCQDEVRRFAVILFPTLMHAYTSTVNLVVRQKVLTAQLKMLSNLDIPILEDALRGVTYASHLASIMSQQENPVLVTLALQAAELLWKRLEAVYRSQFYREGMMAETAKLAQRDIKLPERPAPRKLSSTVPEPMEPIESTKVNDMDDEVEANKIENGGMTDDEDDHEHNGEEENDDEDVDEDEQNSDSSDTSPLNDGRPPRLSDQDNITQQARRFMEAYGSQDDTHLAEKATKVVQDLQELAQRLRKCYADGDSSTGTGLFRQLSQYFSGDALEGITSYELLTSGIVDALLDVFSDVESPLNGESKTAFLEAFMSNTGQTNLVTGSTDSPATAFSVLVHKLQDLLSRTEHFEVVTVQQNAFESNRTSAASMLAKQLRLKLTADDESGIPRPYRNIMVSIHAIATFRALDDYLRPRIALAERPSRLKKRDSQTDNDSSRPGSTASQPGIPGLGATPMSALSNTAKSMAEALEGKSQGMSANPETPEGPPSRLRRSSRKLSAQTPGDALVEPEKTASGEAQHSLECADEARLSDEDDDDDETEAALEAIVGDLEDEMDEDEVDPSAVNLKVANTGKVTARKEDGTRVATPLESSQSSSSSLLSASARLAAAREMLSTPSSMARSMSYASALQAIPQDWHIEFSVNGQPFSNDTTIYRAVHYSQTHPDEASGHRVWSNLHTITFKRAPGPPPPASSALALPSEASSVDQNGLPPSLSQHPQTASILQLMSILHSMNNHLDDVLSEQQATVKLNAEPLAQFVNTKLTAKLNRQLEEPLIVASNCLPSWSEDLARLYPFLFPFETRHLFLQSTSFGYSRSMTRWQNAQPEADSRHSRHRDERPFL